ncbi:MAG TPA: SpoIID/LytB domain-containing protein, partial [Myxococcaceae bacterium]|nr:SpoIID/LytB domain-containing protein [Myxococcaceae bacterium]
MSALGAALLGLVLAAGAEARGQMVRVRVLERLHPHEVLLAGPETAAISARGDALLRDGVEVEQPLLLPEGAWTLATPRAAARRYRGRLSARAAAGELQLLVELPLERYVAEVVAGESISGTPEEALRALAVVVRSFVLAQGPRHAEADVCDLAHCQVLRGTGVSSEHRERARAAADATRGQVLVLASGAVAEAPFHAACGGHTADPRQVLGSAGSGAASVADPGCPALAWAADVPLAAFRAALGPLLDGTGPEGGSLDPAQ